MAVSGNAHMREFEASWRSSIGGATLIFFLIALSLGAFALLGPRGALSWGLLAGAGCMLWLGWLLARQFLSKQPALRVGARGIRAYALKGRKLSWNEIADVRAESVQGHTQVVLTLSPEAAASSAGRRWGNKHELRIPLGSIPKKYHADAVAASVEAFALYGGTHALKAAEAQVAQAEAGAAFEARLQLMTPVTWGLYLMVALNVGVWVANVAAGVGAFKPTSGELLRWGANSAASVVEDRQYWRLLTATFLHAGVMHLALNMLGLWEAGRQLNRLYGNAQFLLIYLASALVGSGLSLHFSAQQSVAVGASGAVFGVLGAALMAMYRHRGQIPGLMSKNIMTSQGVFLVYALGQGFTKDGIDNAAHVGGLLAGMALAWLLAGNLGGSMSPGRRRSAQAVGLLLPALVVAGLVMTTPQPTVHHRQLFEFQAGMARLLPGMQAAEKALQADAKALSTGALTPLQFANAIETRHLPAYLKFERDLQPLGVPANDQAAPYVNDIKRTHSLLVAMMQVELARANNPSQNDLGPDAKLKAIHEELKRIKGRSDAREAAKKATK